MQPNNGEEETRTQQCLKQDAQQQPPTTTPKTKLYDYGANQTEMYAQISKHREGDRGDEGQQQGG